MVTELRERDAAGGPARSPRVDAVDVARALIIVGVVLNHAVDGLVGAGLLDRDGGLGTVNAGLYLFRMPALAFLLGLFVPRAVARGGSVGYARERVATMLYLYLVWFYVESAFEIGADRFTNGEHDASALLEPWVTIAHLWFLPFLAVVALVLAVTRPWASRLRAVTTLGGTTALGLLLWGWTPSVVGLPGLALLPFVVVGALIGVARLGDWMTRLPLGAWLAAGSACAALFVLLDRRDPLIAATLDESAPAGIDALSMVAAALGTVAVLAVAVAIARVPALTRPLAAIGRRTLSIYLAHVVVVAGLRVLLDHAGVTSIAAYMLLLVPGGVLLPMAVAAAVRDRPWANWIFELPAPLARRVRPRPVPESAALPA